MTERMPFKTLSAIFEHDVRNTYISFVNKETGESRQYALSDLHRELDNIKINIEAPIEIRDLYNLSKNLCLYGWYVYDFGVAAELYSFIGLEAALKMKYKEVMGEVPKRSGLHKLCKWAIGQKLGCEPNLTY